MRTILIFGDSNVWGYVGGSGARYPVGVRWPTVAAAQLGREYHVIEDGMCGRTSVYADPLHERRCGVEALDYALISATPLDLLVLMLGTNDLKYAGADRSAQGILVISPIHIGSAIAEYEEWPFICRFGIQESLKFSEYYREVAERRGAYFLDAAQYAEPCREDSEHMTASGHQALGKAAAAKILEIFS